MGRLNGFFGLIILFADIYAIMKIVQSGADTTSKAIWTFLVVVLPVLGLIVWFFAGPGRSAA
jgi:succinate dehydrogenase/fumarate reductase cytochrome b subunit